MLERTCWLWFIAMGALHHRDVARYKNFLALDNEGAAKVAAAAMKARGDFTTPGNDMAAIAATKAAGFPVDAFLSTNELKEGDLAARCAVCRFITCI
jgi:hypothetical protein